MFGIDTRETEQLTNARWREVKFRGLSFYLHQGKPGLSLYMGTVLSFHGY